MTTIESRLGRLHLVYRRPEGCGHCRTWGPAVCLRDDEAPRPKECPLCGRSVPIRLTRRYLLRRGPHGRLPPAEDPTDPAFVGWPTTETT